MNTPTDCSKEKLFENFQKTPRKPCFRGVHDYPLLNNLRICSDLGLKTAKSIEVKKYLGISIK